MIQGINVVSNKGYIEVSHQGYYGKYEIYKKEFE